MARVAGIDLPKNKRVDVALTYIFGVGEAKSRKILQELGEKLDPSVRVKDLSEEQVGLLNQYFSKDQKVEGELRRELQQHMRRFVEINSYRGLRHRKGLPCRGQRTKTNGRTRRGKRRTVGGKTPGK